ncbi:MAG: hypothetical protein M1826_002795 [Phylliscum demangeonii]|nr:MAG: hypothetical protein M1826_002795 [Phylliscum demangeonii]
MTTTLVGNYPGYQGSRNRHHGLPRAGAHVRDARLVLIERLRPHIFRHRHLLDVGCHQGEVAVQLATTFHAGRVTGIDLDPDLIRRAWSHLSFHQSRMLRRTKEPQRPAASSAAGEGPASYSDHCYFPLSSVLDHGHRPQCVPGLDPRQRRGPDDCDWDHAKGGGDGGGDGDDGGDDNDDEEEEEAAEGTEESAQARFPHNVSFVCEDWAAAPVPSDHANAAAAAGGGRGRRRRRPHRRKPTENDDDDDHHHHQYDTILALSVVKWIHLQHLDAGLRRFLARCHAVLRPGGELVLEIQPWSSYEKAVRPNKAPHLAPNLARLTLRPDRVCLDALLAEMGFALLAEAEEDLPRRIAVYRRL